MLKPSDWESTGSLVGRPIFMTLSLRLDHLLQIFNDVNADLGIALFLVKRVLSASDTQYSTLRAESCVIIHPEYFSRKGGKMTVKVVVRRIVSEHRVGDLEPLLRQLETRAMHHQGYISGETLRRLDKPEEYLVISTWESAEDWNRWAKSQERNEVQGKIDTLLGWKTEYGIFHSAFSKRHPDS